MIVTSTGIINGVIDAEYCKNGMAPPDAPHLYELHVFALDSKLNLDSDFLMNDMYKNERTHLGTVYSQENLQ